MNHSGDASSWTKRLPWIVAAAAIAALVFVLLQRGGSTPDSAQAEEMARLQERLAALEQARGPGGGMSGDGTLAGRYAAQAAARGAGLADGTLRRGPGGRNAMTPAQQRAERERLQQRLQAEFAADAPDAAGGAAAETRLEEAVVGSDMASTGLVPDDLAVDCRRTMCRVSADFTKAGDAEDWAMMYLSAAGGAISRARTVQVRQPDGSTQVIIYGVRGK